MAASEVAGHLARGSNGAWEPLLADCTTYFSSIYKDEVSRVAEQLQQRPQLLDNLHTLLYWGSEPGVEARQVQVQRRSALMIAAQFGSTKVLSFLLEQGADVAATVPEDGCTALQVAESFSDASTSTKMIEMIREALQKMPSTSTYPPQRPGGGRQGGEQYMTQPYQHYQGAVHHVYPQPSHQDDGGFPDPNSELVLPDFSSDEFRVYHFKITRCSKRFAHDWRSCPFAHPTENARRRDPRLFQYCAISCPDYKQGFCSRGDACGFAHGVFEVHLHPSRYRTQLCKDGPQCHRPVCFFAHRLDELRTPTHTWLPSAEELGAAGLSPAMVASAIGAAAVGGVSSGAAVETASYGIPLPGALQHQPQHRPALSPIPRAPNMSSSAASSAGGSMTPSPPPYGAHEAAAEHFGRSSANKAGSAVSAAAVMAYDELLGSAAGFLDSIPSSLDAIGRPMLPLTPVPAPNPTSVGLPSSSMIRTASPTTVIGAPTVNASSASSIMSSADAAAIASTAAGGGGDQRQRVVGSASSGGTASSGGHAVEASLHQQHLGLLPGGGPGVERTSPSSVGGGFDLVASAAATSSLAPSPQPFHRSGGSTPVRPPPPPPPPPSAADPPLLGFNAPRMSNAFARRHGLNPRDNPMINMQKLALQTQAAAAAAAAQQQVQQHLPPNAALLPANLHHDATVAGGGYYGGGRYQQQQQPLRHHQQYQQQQNAYGRGGWAGGNGHHQPFSYVGGGGGGAAVLSSGFPGGVAQGDSYMDQQYSGGQYGGGESSAFGAPYVTGNGGFSGGVGAAGGQGSTAAAAASMAMLNSSLAALNLHQQQQQQQHTGVGAADVAYGGGHPQRQYGLGGC